MTALIEVRNALISETTGLAHEEAFAEYQSLPLPIGKGVWRWWHIPSQQWHCIKVRSDKSGRYLLDHECEVLAQIQQPCAPQLIQKIVTPHQTIMITRYVEGNTLAAVIRRKGPGFQGHQQVMMHLVDALVECHKSHIVHGDIKPNNLILAVGDASGVGNGVGNGDSDDCDSTVRLIDFGHAMAVGSNLSQLSYRGFSPSYSHPSLKQGRIRVTPDLDWYAFFVVMHVTCHGTLPTLNWASEQPLIDGFLSMIQGSGLPTFYQRYLSQRLADLDLSVSHELGLNKHRNQCSE
ncbi:protein kinase [Litoribrevibacter euphylliae]|uniref:Protein kinase n=1 Tax=Litoribrevibacter euphylliae TaxID=1834034 RepID=A0ABV7HFW2_9GAMM